MKVYAHGCPAVEMSRSNCRRGFISTQVVVESKTEREGLT